MTVMKEPDLNTFLGIGECMVEIASRDEGGLCQNFAGDVLNSLWYARGFLPDGWKAEFFTGFGADRISEEMRQFIEGAGISCQHCPTFSDRTVGLYLIHLGNGERSFSYWRDTSAARSMARDISALWARVAKADLVYLSGISLAILPPEHRQVFLGEIRENMRNNAILAFDPNIRPRLWEDRDVMLDTLSRAGGISDIVLPSFEDEAINFGDRDPHETARRYLDLGAKLVVVKNGADPTIAFRKDDRFEMPVEAVQKLVDSTAAGDSFNGAFLARMLSGCGVPKAMEAAQRCSARVVSQRGALVPVE